MIHVIAKIHEISDTNVLLHFPFLPKCGNNWNKSYIMERQVWVRGIYCVS